MTTKEARRELETYAHMCRVLERLRSDARVAGLAARSPNKPSSPAASEHGGSYDEKIVRMLDKKQRVTDAERCIIFVDIILDTIFDTAEKKCRKVLIDFCIKNKSCEVIASEVSASMPRVYQIIEEALEIYIFNRGIIVQMLDFDPFAHDKTDAVSHAHAREL